VAASTVGGVFIKQGSGTLTLEGQSIFTGAVTINAGTLALADFGDLSLSSLVTVATGATFDISASSFPFSGIGNLAGGGTVQLGNMGLVLANASGEFGGSIVDSGYGGLQIFGGSITLTGVSTYRNVTQIWQGASLALKDAGSIADSLYIAFALNSTGRATFDISQTTAGASVGGLYDPFGIGVVSLGGKTLTITNGTGTFNGVIQDGGVGGGTGGALTLAASAQQGLGRHQHLHRCDDDRPGCGPSVSWVAAASRRRAASISRRPARRSISPVAAATRRSGISPALRAAWWSWVPTP
jgi:autotransporter-associated beta strand protein